jgi:hypothetical protein
MQTNVAPRLAVNSVHLLPAERQMLAFTGLVGVIAVGLALVLHREVNWPPFCVGYAATVLLALMGGHVREAKAAPRIALALVGAAIFAGFTAVSSLFIFLLFPLSNPLIDPLLLRIDAMAGYDWPGLVAWLAERPALAWVLGYVYNSSLFQIALTILLLAGLSREVVLHRFLFVGILAMVFAVAIWWIVPSIGPSAFQTIPEEHVIATGLYFSPAHGDYLRALVEVGPPRVSPEAITGVVAFPSYHMIMALMVVWFTRGTIAFGPALAVNAAMVPATLSHGGHHLVDLVGGLAVFALCVWIAGRVIRTEPSRLVGRG